MSESKVVRYGLGYDGMSATEWGYWVTHADYKALEDRVRELVGADQAYDDCLEHAVVPLEAVLRRKVALSAFA